MSILFSLFRLPVLKQVLNFVIAFVVMSLLLKVFGLVIVSYAPWINRNLFNLYLISLTFSFLLPWFMVSILKWSTLIYLPSLAYQFMKSKPYLKPYLTISDSDFLKYSLITLGSFLILKSIYRLIKPKPKNHLNLTLEEIDKFGANAGKAKNQKKGAEFELYIKNLYEACGYIAMTTTEMKQNGKIPPQLIGLSGDGGADVIVFDPHARRQLVVQCKHYSDKVGREAIYQAAGAKKTYGGVFKEAEEIVSVVVTNQFFTEEAKVTAKDNDVILIDRNKLPLLISNAIKKAG